ncbi:MAG: HAD hydrolase family protein [Oceanospirillales bacterium]|uniref:3-deoxy-D-manno-octulosonate 8-phosphate phosphatase KdsC n=1 Tax=Marinobacterium halophilum TaxID=267374 RepID=A0A2P8EYP4_9GAMM|nr:HAD hydrolase family protein [Marinobacterium halophilum]MBR9827223.1 HAD hydrolase family protein [Oceanospirillales bacterium]PSL14597.1 3-deoxy-D-manno-octulosonate 8-phosphate phosphatase (KDO 8-P phosphatase) [Marinobacterium halophilum]
MHLDSLSPQLRDALSGIRLAVFDVDGILTDGRLNFLADGREVKSFHTLDGLGIKLLQRCGIETAIITGRRSPQVEHRAEALGITYLRQGREDKLVALNELWAHSDHSAADTAYIGDDLPDLSAIRACAFGACVPNGHPLVRKDANWTSTAAGGKGAAREFCELILAAQNKLDAIYAEYRGC